jgi:hypothetical protein
MTITQKFYPKFFNAAFRTESAPFFNDDDEMVCYIDLYDASATFDPELYFMYPTGIFEHDIAGTTKQITITASKTGSKLYFDIPNVHWETAPGVPFRHAIIRARPNTIGGFAFMHIDFGEELNPTLGFTLSQSESCLPHIDFTPIACGGGGTPLTTLRYSGAKLGALSGEFSLIDITAPNELNWNGTMSQVLNGEFTIE